MIGDLHCHTRLSDGSMNIDDVVFYAKRAGLDFLAITDHDTMAGCTRAAIVGNRMGIGIIPGVEFSCFDPSRGRKVHLLCYQPEKPDRLEGICSRTTEARNRAGMEMIQKVMRYYPVAQDHVGRYSSGSKAVYKAHILHALMDLGYTDRIYGDLFQELFGKGGTCRVPFEYPDVEKVAATVKDAGGLAVLAHPASYDSFDLLDELGAKNLLDGVELYYPGTSPEDFERIAACARKYGLITTGGSDFHGYYHLQPNPIASAITGEEALGQIFQRKKKSTK